MGEKKADVPFALLFCVLGLWQVDYNMGTAHKRDAVLHRKFHWRKNICDPQDETVTSYTINEIINGAVGTVGSFAQMCEVVL